MLALFKVLNVSSYQSEDSHKCLLILDVSELHSRLLKHDLFWFYSLQMESQAWVESVSVSERCCAGPRWGTHRGLPPDPQWGESNRERVTGGEVSRTKPPATIVIVVIIQTQCGWVQRSAAQQHRRTGIINNSRKSTSRGARQQSNASS